MDKNHVIYNSGNSIKVCSTGDFESVLKFVRLLEPSKEWAESLFCEPCYGGPGRKHYTIHTLEFDQSPIEKKWGVVPSFIKRFLKK